MRFIRGSFLLPIIALLLNASHPTIAASAAPSVTLRWTTPGDDGILGRATRYDLRYSTTPLTAATFLSATVVTGVQTPKAAGVRDSCTVKGLKIGVIYYFALKTVDDASNWSQLSNVLLRAPALVGVEEAAYTFSFEPPWPNPASQSAHFAYTLPTEGPLSIQAFDVSGRRVRLIADNKHPAGRGDTVWDLRDDSGHRVNPGIYLVTMRTTGASSVRRLVVSG